VTVSVSASLSVVVVDVVVETVVIVREDTDVVMLVRARRELHLETSTQLCAFSPFTYEKDELLTENTAVVVLAVDVVLPPPNRFFPTFVHCIRQENKTHK